MSQQAPLLQGPTTLLIIILEDKPQMHRLWGTKDIQTTPSGDLEDQAEN